jgi:Flp pilus assembly secretin CpaC/tetratricopeptide (TPR) repeat protein
MRFRTLLVPPFLALTTIACNSTVSPELPGAAEAAGLGQDAGGATGTDTTAQAIDDATAESAAAEPRANVAARAPREATARTAEAVDVSAASIGAIGGFAALQDGVDLEQVAERQARLQERKQILVDEYLRDAQRQITAGEYAEALQSVANALDLIPGDARALQDLQRIETFMGDKFATAQTYMDDVVQREAVRRAQARIEARRAIDAGQREMADANYDAALLEFRRAELILGYNPLIASDDIDLQSLQRLIAAAEAERDAARLLAAQRQAAAAEAAAAEAEEAERRYRENTLRTLYERANAAFLAERYKEAEQLADQILLQDPGNSAATEMREIARSARHQRVDEELRRTYREEWIRTFEDLDTLAVPQSDSVVIDDLERWYHVSERKPFEFAGSVGSTDDEREAILARLRNTRVEARFGGEDDGAELAEVAAYLQQRTGVNFVISPLVRELDEEETAVSLDLPARNVVSLLDLIAETSEGLFWKIEDGVVKFVVAEELTGGQVLNMYEVRDLVTSIPDNVSREINVLPSQGIEYPEEDLPEREALVLTGDDLVELITTNIAAESWDADDKNSIEVTDSGTLVVNQTPEVQEQIAQLLKDLRDSAGIMVDIQARFLEVEDNFLEDIGVDFRGLGQPGLGADEFFNDFGNPSSLTGLAGDNDILGTDTDAGAFYNKGGDGEVAARIENLYDGQLGDGDFNGAGGLSFQWTYLNDLQFELILRAVSKSQRVELVTAPRILIFNTARSHLSILNQQAYVQDYDVEIATAASIADPIIAVVEEGVVLDVRPVVSADRRYITLELRPTVATLRRPIRTLTTGLANLTPVTIQLPELDIQKVRTTVPIPDGATVLLGGLKVHTEENFQSGVPLLNKIPLVRFFFERKGSYIANRKLLVLLKAGIVIPRESEPTEAQMKAFSGVGAR